jgi:DNA polymerase-3 subunit alpha
MVDKMKHECCGVEHVHLHTDTGSLLDGFGQPEEYASFWKSQGDYLCISDHGMMSAIPRQIRACEASGKKDDPYKDKKLKPIFAVELYVNPLQIEYSSEDELQSYIKSLNPEDLKLMRHRGNHLLAIACNDTGYTNLVKLTSLAWTKGLYYRPRVNHEQLKKYKEGIIFTSCCYASEIGQAFDKGGEEAGFRMIEKYREMFGSNFYLEIIMLDFVKQKPYDKFIIKAHEKYGIPIIITQDVHYLKQEDSKYQRLMLMVQTQTTLQEIERKLNDEGITDMFELQDQNLWMKTEDELNQKWEESYSDTIDYEIFKQAKRNTVEICRKAANVQMDRTMKLPHFPNENDRLKEEIFKGFKQRELPKNEAYLARIKHEYELICHKEFSSYFLIQKLMTDEARRVCPILLGWGDGSEAVGPGRGSSVASLVCYCLGITDVDPMQHGLLFSRFLSEARGGKSVKLRFS